MTMVIDRGAPVGARVHDVSIGGQSLDPARRYTLAIPDYAIPDYVLKGGDAYSMFASQVLVGPNRAAC